MSTYPQTTHHPEQFTGSGTAARPTTLTAAVGAAIAVAVLNIISAIAIITSASDLVRQQIADNPGLGEPPIDPSLVDMTSDRAQGLETVYSGLAYAMVFWALALAALAYFALRGGRVTRIFATVILVVTALLKGADAFMTLPTISFIADILVGVLAPVAIVMFFLPASNAYGRLRRAARR